MKKLSNDLQIECPYCKKINPLGQWNKNTKEKCDTAEKKRTYTPMNQLKVFLPKAEFAYACPDCNAWMWAHNVTIISDSPRYKNLGRVPVIHQYERE